MLILVKLSYALATLSYYARFRMKMRQNVIKIPVFESIATKIRVFYILNKLT